MSIVLHSNQNTHINMKTGKIKDIFAVTSIILTFMLTLFAIIAQGQCTHTIRLTDTYGDGWNGGTVTVTVNGTPVLTDITLATGSGPEDHAFTASTGDVINIVRTADGSYPWEMQIQIFDNTMAGLLGPVEPQSAPGHTVTGSCVTCAAPSTVTASVSANDVIPGTAVTFSYVSHTGGLCSGSWEYQWETTGGTVLQPWSTSQNYSTTATNDMFVILKMRCSDCPLQTATSNVLNFNVLIPPVNDFPCDAILLSTYTSCNYQWESNSDATDSGIPSPGCASYNGADVWYKTVVGGSGNLLVQTDAGTITDGGLAIYSGSCNSLTLIECNDDGGPGGMEKILRTGLTPGDTIWIRVWRFGGGTGTFQICASDPRYILNGSAQEAPQYGADCVIITQNSPSQGACVWNSTGLIDFSQTFDYEITVYLGDNDGGADGITFTFHRDPAGLTACGTNGGHLGMLGVSPSWSVEIDTYDNGWAWHDIFDDHIAIFANGDNSLPLIAGPVSATNPPSNIEDGNTHLLRIVWDPASMLFSVYFDGQLRLSVTYDIINSVFGGDPMVYWGFTGSTGMAYNLQYFCPNDLPLPLTFVQFSYECREKNTLLQWITASEQNTQMFFIEKSDNMNVWEHIDVVYASGNTNTLTTYQYEIARQSEGAFYRVREVDVDGQEFVSGVIFTQCNSGQEFMPLLYPNPAHEALFVEYCPSAEFVYPVEVKVIDIAGKTVHSQTFSTDELCSGSMLNIEHLSMGTYIIQIIDNYSQKQHTSKLQITR